MTIESERATPPEDGGRAPEPDEARTRADDTKAGDASPDDATAKDDAAPFGRPGRPLDRRSPFFVGMTGAAGVAVTYGLIQIIIAARSVLILIGLAMFIAAGLDPLVTWLTRHRLPRWAR